MHELSQVSKAHALRKGHAEDEEDRLVDISAETPVGAEKIGLGAHVDPLPPRHEIERCLKRSVIIEKTSPHDHVARVAVDGCQNCGTDLSLGLYQSTAWLSASNVVCQPHSEAKPNLQPQREPEEPAHQPSPDCVQPALVSSQSVTAVEDLEGRKAAAKTELAARMETELSMLRRRCAQLSEEVTSTDKRCKLALQAAATAVQNAEQKYVACQNVRVHSIYAVLLLLCVLQAQSSGVGKGASREARGTCRYARGNCHCHI